MARSSDSGTRPALPSKREAGRCPQRLRPPVAVRGPPVLVKSEASGVSSRHRRDYPEMMAGRPMLRVWIVTYLIATTLAGPRLCLCPVPPTTTCGASVPRDDAPGPRGCCGAPRSTPRDSSPATPRPCPDRVPAPCQCQSGERDAAAAVRSVGRTPCDSPDRDDWTGLDRTCDAPAPIRHALGSGGVRDVVCRTTFILLYVFHHLRC